MRTPMQRLFMQLKNSVKSSTNYHGLVGAIALIVLDDEHWIEEEANHLKDSTPQPTNDSKSLLYAELSEIESMFGRNSNHKVLKYVQKRMNELLESNK